MNSHDTHIDARMLKRYRPLHRLSDNDRSLLFAGLSVRSGEHGKKLIDMGSTDPRALYLINGALKLISSDGREVLIREGTDMAFDPVSHLLPHRYDVYCDQHCTYFRIENRVLDLATAMPDRDGEYSDIERLPDGLPDTDMFREICRELVEDRLILGITPQVLAHMERVCMSEAQYLKQPVSKLAHMYSTDPALAAWLMRGANSEITTTPDVHCHTMEGALMGIGLLEARNWFLQHLRYLGVHCVSSPAKNRLHNYWTHSTEVAAISYMLAREVKGLDPDQAYMAGLLHDIGMLPMIQYADRNLDDISDARVLNLLIRDYHGTLGALIMDAWGLPWDLVTVATESDNWYRDPSGPPDLSDVVLVAQLHSFIGKKLNVDTPPVDAAHLPTISKVPAFRKLGFQAEDPRHSWEIIARARRYFTEISRFAHFDKLAAG